VFIAVTVLAELVMDKWLPQEVPASYTLASSQDHIVTHVPKVSGFTYTNKHARRLSRCQWLKRLYSGLSHCAAAPVMGTTGLRLAQLENIDPECAGWRCAPVLTCCHRPILDSIARRRVSRRVMQNHGRQESSEYYK
jgi:hypothetical protein